jgi:glycerate kinase
MAYYLKLENSPVTVLDPLFRKRETYFLSSEEEQVCFIEMAKASGLDLLKPSEFNCALTTSYGTGEVLKQAIQSGAKKIILGIGGSATNDCGIGMANAVGYKFLDKHSRELKPIGKNLAHIHSIDTSNRIRFDNISVRVACDVDNFVAGPQGAARVYAPQKGATPEMVEELEEGMLHFCHIVKKELGTDMTTIPGGGAAGGMGAGCVAFLGADLVSGTDLVFRYSNAEQEIQKADVVITGEGKIDEQTLYGKLVYGVGQLCLKYKKPLIAVCGTLDIDGEKLGEAGINAAFSILQKPVNLPEAFEEASFLLTETSYSIASLLQAFKPAR